MLLPSAGTETPFSVALKEVIVPLDGTAVNRSINETSCPLLAAGNPVISKPTEVLVTNGVKVKIEGATQPPPQEGSPEEKVNVVSPMVQGVPIKLLKKPAAQEFA